MSRGFGFIGILFALFIAGIAGTIGYNLGLSAGLAGTSGGGAAVVYAPWGFGFPFFGFFFTILFIVLIFALIRRAAWGGRGMGYGGPGLAGRRWDHRNLPPMVDQTLQDWHRRAHGEPAEDPQDVPPRS